MKLYGRRVLLAMACVWCLSACSSAATAEAVNLAGLAAEVNVEVDGYGVPHVYADSWTDAARVLGYLHASDRLWQMDMFRRRGSGTSAEVIGKSGLDDDILMRRLGTRRSCEALWKSNDVPAEMRAELDAYADGVNARIAELGEKNLPAAFAMLGYRPAPWTPVDTLVFSKYMGWDQSGTDADLWFGMMVDKLGIDAVEALWPIDRPYEIPAVKVQASWPQAGGKNGGNAALVPIEGAAPAYAAALAVMSKTTSPFRGLSFGSNNWAVDGTKTASGKPILCNDPHLGFHLPSIWYTCHVSVGGENVAGVTFPSGPVFVIGHNDHIAWGVTNAQTDAVDYFVETVDDKDPLRYRHRGQWKTMTRRREEIAVRGEKPVTLDIDATVHGPIISREGRTVSLQWTGLKPTRDLVAFHRLSHARNLADYRRALADLEVPALNVAYADDAGNIALHPCGLLPVRMHGQGRIPLEGASGENDWTEMIPRDRLPLVVNPSEHFVASANGRPAAVGYPYYIGWMWDVSYRIRRINDMLAKAESLTVDSMQAIQTDHYDKAAERFVPVLVAALARSALGDPIAQRAVDELKKWNFVADIEAIAPVIWLRWFDKYREAVWNDEWASRGITQPGGSWGFSGTNHREPMLEVLEFMTREHPTSSWFDDRGTSERETRDDIVRRSFAAAVDSLVKEFGNDMEKWRWGGHNELYVGSLLGAAELSRSGIAVVGDEFTVNPGSNIGRVDGGASFRMIVDLAAPSKSVGVYPGGQSENPESPHYADQIEAWAKRQYLPLDMTGDRAKLPAEAKQRSLVFSAK